MNDLVEPKPPTTDTSNPAEADNTPQATLLHCQALYKKMFERARHNEEYNTLVYEGSLTKLITHDLNLSVPYYTKLTRPLKAMGCIKQLKRGGGSSNSMWEIVYEPTEELYEQYEPRKPRRNDKYEMVQGQIVALNSRVNTLEQQVATLVGAMAGE